jgi:hypothetical protein
MRMPALRATCSTRLLLRPRRGVALIDTLAACAMLILVFAMVSGQLAEWSNRVSAARSALAQMAIPRRALLALAENAYTAQPTGTTTVVFDTVRASYTRITNNNATRVPRYEIILTDVRADAAIRPDTFQVDINPWITVPTGFSQGDARP